MLFNSYLFLLAFLPLVLALFYCISKRSIVWGKQFLLIASVLFICRDGYFHGAIALLSTLLNFMILRLMRKAASVKGRQSWLTLGILFNVGLLCFFKYAPHLGFSVVSPLGISFYSFQQIAFLVDTYRQTCSAVSVTDYSLFILLFPKTVQGPVLYGSELLPDLRKPEFGTFSAKDFSGALYLFAIGLAKKVLIADKLAIIADYGFASIHSLSGLEALLTILAYTFQLYFDFSGYSDMAVALGRMFGIELPNNFNSPYKAKNITDFWKRWHITLSRFLTKYIYIPLGGNRKGMIRTCVNIVIVYLVSGLWHGTGPGFLLWGLLHAAASILYRLLKKPYDRLPGLLQWFLQFSFINVTWVFFRLPSVSSALALLGRLFRGNWALAINAELAESLLQPTFLSIAAQFLPITWTLLLAFTGLLMMAALCKNTGQLSLRFRPNLKTLIVSYLLLLFSILSMSSVSSFLYTNF